MTTVTITLDSQKEANLLISIAKKLMSVKSIKEGKRNIAAKGEPMDLKEFTDISFLAIEISKFASF